PLVHSETFVNALRRPAAQSLTSADPGFSPTCSHAIRARSHCASLEETPDTAQEDRIGGTTSAPTIQSANLRFTVAPFPDRAFALRRQARPCSPRNAHYRGRVASCRRRYVAIAPIFPA